MEDRYDFLLARVGQTLSSHANLPKLLTYITLFSDEKIVTNPEVPPRDVNKIRSIQVRGDPKKSGLAFDRLSLLVE